MNGDVKEVHKLNNNLQLTAHKTAIFFFVFVLMTERKDITRFIAHDKATGAWNTHINLQNHRAETFQKEASCPEPVLEASGFQSSTVQLEDPTSEKYSDEAILKETESNTHQASSAIPPINRL